MRYSIVICTLDRVFELRMCLTSLFEHKIKAMFMDKIYVIYSNNLENLKEEFPEIIFLKNPKTGLSNSRNMGIKVTSSEWIVFLDDDCYVDVTFFIELEKTINNYNFDAFTGSFLAWHYYKRPKWININFGSKIIHAKNIELLGEKDYVSGGIMAFKMCAFNLVGDFSSELGMKPDRLGYGEETFLIKKMQKKGLKIGINPNWVIHHLVRKEKYTIKWQLRHYFAMGKSNQMMFNNLSYASITKSGLKGFIIHLGQNSIKLLKFPNYYWQNWIVDTFKLLAIMFGKIKGKTDSKKLLSKND